MLGVTARSSGAAALSYNPRLDCLLYAAGSTLVLWNYLRDTRLYLEGDGHASTISAIAVTSDGNHVASASFEGCGAGDQYTSHPTVVLWDVTGKKDAGGAYSEIHRSRRVSCSDPACSVVTSMQLAFSPGDGVLASLSVCEPSNGSSSGMGTLQLCLFDWKDGFRLLQRCTIQGDGEGGAERSVHIFAPEHVMGLSSPPGMMGGSGGLGTDVHGANSTVPTGTAPATNHRPPTFREETREEMEKREEGRVIWCDDRRLCVVYGCHVWALDFVRGSGAGLSVVHCRNLRDKLSERSQRTKKALKFRQRKKEILGGIEDNIDSDTARDPHSVVGAAICVPYNLLVLLSRSGRLLVCETSTCSVVNSVPPPVDDKELSSVFTALSVDGEETTVGTSSGTLWSLSMRELKWRRPLPFQRRMRARLLGGNVSGGMAATKDKNIGSGLTYQRGWPVVAALSLPQRSNSNRNAANGSKNAERIAAMYGDHSIAVFELSSQKSSAGAKRRGATQKQNGSGGNKGGVVTNHAVGHFGAVRSVTWHPEKTSSVLITTSADQSIGVWQLTPILDDLGAPEEQIRDGMLPAIGAATMNSNASLGRSSSEAPTERRARMVRVLDVSSSISADLPYSRCSRVTLDIANFDRIDNRSGRSESIEVSALAYHPLGGRIACGDNHGMIRIYSTVSGRLLHLRDTTGGNNGDGGGNGAPRHGTSMDYVDMEGGEVHGEGESEDNHPDDVRASRAISAMSFSPTGRYVGVARRDGKTMVLDGWCEWCRGCVLTAPCLDPFSGHAEGVISFVMRPSLPRHATPRDPTPTKECGERNSTAESVRGTCCVVALSPSSVGLLTVVPVTAGGGQQHHQRHGTHGVGSGTTTDVGAVEWQRGFEPTRLLSEYRLDGALRACHIHPSKEYVVCLTSKGTPRR